MGHLTYSEKLDRLGLTTLEEQRAKADMVQVWKILNGYDDADEKKWFVRAATVSNRTTRASADILNLKEPSFKGNIRKNFFSVRVCKPWNEIPSEIRGETNLITFKKKYDAWKTPAII